MKNVTLTIDLSDTKGSEKVRDAALALVQQNGSDLHVVSVMPDFGLSQVSGYFKKGFEKEALAEFGEALAKWVKDNIPAGITVHPHILHGTIYDEILRAAKKLEADVIVIGSHRPKLKDYLLGPNAARVVRHARQSVFVVRG